MKKTNEYNEELTESEFKKTLKELKNTIYWRAIQKFNFSILSAADSNLRTLDPVKSPTEIARTQGKIAGLYFLENYIEELINRKQEDNVEIKY